MKKNWLWGLVVIIVVLLFGGYVARHRIELMLGMTPTRPVNQLNPTLVPTSQSSVIAPSDNIYKIKTDSVNGQYVTDFQGMTLYTFDKDTSGVSNCYTKCAILWPFYTSGATAESVLPTNITVINRTDGGKQFVWKGMPLYYYSKDQKAGDISGDGVGGVWHIVKP